MAMMDEVQEELTFGSLFDGLGCFSFALQEAGWTQKWLVEIEEDCRLVTSQRLPGVAQYSDVTTVDPIQMGAVDLIVGGWPCTDLSIAGKRAGLAGDKSGLFREVIRIADALRPSYLLLENVPGLLSSFDGADFRHVLDELWRIGYLVDADILDTQHFGLAQRRRRIFFVCRSVESMIKLASPDLALACVQAMAEAAHSVLRWHEGELSQKQCQEICDWRVKFVESIPPSILGLAGLSSDQNGGGLGRMLAILHALSGADEPSECLCDLAETLSILAAVQETVGYERPHYWSAASALEDALTAYREHARRTVSSLFDDVERHDRWHLFLPQTKLTRAALRSSREPLGLAGAPSGGEPGGLRSLLAQVLPVRPRVQGHPAQGGEAGAEAARRAAAGPGGSRGHGARQADGDVAFALTSSARGTGDGHGEAHNSTYVEQEFPEGEVVGSLATGRSEKGHGMAGVNSQAVAAGHVVPCGDEVVGSLTAPTKTGGPRDGCDDAMAGHVLAGALQAHTRRHGDAMHSGQAAESGHVVVEPGTNPETAPCLRSGNVYNASDAGQEAQMLVMQPQEETQPTAFRSQMGGNDGGVHQDGTTPATTSTAPPAVAYGCNRSSGEQDLAGAINAKSTMSGRQCPWSETFLVGMEPQEEADQINDVDAHQCQGSNVGPMGTIRAGNGNEAGGVPFLAQNVHGEEVTPSLVARSSRGGNTPLSAGGTTDGLMVAQDDQTLYSIMPQNSGKDFKAREVEVAQPVTPGGSSRGDRGGDFVLGKAPSSGEEEAQQAIEKGEPLAFDWQAGGAGKDESFRGGSRKFVVRKPGAAGACSANRVDAVIVPPETTGTISPGQGGGSGHGYRQQGCEDQLVVGPDVAAPLTSGGSPSPGVNQSGRRQEDDVNVVAFTTKESGKDATMNLTPTLRAESGDPHPTGRMAVAHEGDLTFIHPRQMRGSESSNQVGIKPGARVSDALTGEGPGAVAYPTEQQEAISTFGEVSGLLTPSYRGASASSGSPNVILAPDAGVADVAPPLTSNYFGDHESREGLLVAQQQPEQEARSVNWHGRGMEVSQEETATSIRSGGVGNVGDQMGYVLAPVDRPAGRFLYRCPCCAYVGDVMAITEARCGFCNTWLELPPGDQGDSYRCASCSHLGKHLSHPRACPRCEGESYHNAQVAPRLGPDAGATWDFEKGHFVGGVRRSLEATPLTGDCAKGRKGDPSQGQNVPSLGVGEPGDPSYSLQADPASVPGVAYEQGAIGFLPTGGTHGVDAHPEQSPTVKVGSGVGAPASPAVAYNIVGLAQQGKNHAVPTELSGTVNHTGTNPTGGNAGTVAFHVTQDPISSEKATPALSAGNRSGCGTVGVAQEDPAAIAFTERTREGGRNLESQKELAYAITNPGEGGRSDQRTIASSMTVRRLTPVECLRLQGLPDWWLDVTPPLSDSAKYRMIGNSGGWNVIDWLGRRIGVVERFDRARARRIFG